MSRIDQLQKLLASEPADLFLNFALAMELSKLGRTDESLAQFDRVIALNEHYAAAYFQKAKTQLAAGDHHSAKATLELGIERAKSGGDQHAADEMSELLAAL